MRGIIIINTGSPASVNKKDVEWFIGAMLSDPMVMTVPDWIRNTLACRLIAPLRASKSASHYSLIWGDKNQPSPLVRHTLRLAQKVEKEAEFPVEIAMRYGKPSIADALENIQEKCSSLHEVIILPMFPQYAQSSYQTVVDEVARVFYQKSYPFRLKIIEPFYNNPAYIEALATSLKPHIEKDYDRLVFSFHSLPLSHEQKAREKGKQFDYVYQIKETIRLVSKELKLDVRKNRLVYSSAIGNKWLEPSLTATMRNLPLEKNKNIIVVTPGFPADNLETLFDINIEARNIFLKNGGENFVFAHALNSEDYWVNAVIKMVTREV